VDPVCWFFEVQMPAGEVTLGVYQRVDYPLGWACRI